ncbi:MAG TPA: 4-hydroxy-3-methylbut-2-enyl diphosphate reductase, partial [Candidatus Polarisedimenticolaceae bacterium]|nr:4-hydroxy-3-methylbut-2-enyl diphosphate reductase [Candidatus Polarisedimenticolaceae bacterium]
MVEKLYLAKPRGFCAGVVMAIEAVERSAEQMRRDGLGELSVYHAIVHNDTVVGRLAHEHGVHFVEDLDELARLEDRIERRGGRLSDTVVFSAHGVSPAVLRRADELGLHTIDATCPLVTKVHSEAKKYARLGYHILLIGDSTTHQEVIGTRGEAPRQTTVVSVVGNRKHDPGLADAESVQVPDPSKVVVLTQTTLSVDDTARTIDILRRRFPRLVVPSRDDLCYATKNRQDAVRKIAERVDLFLVVTSDYSSNGMRLLELAESLTGNARRIESVADLDEQWFDGVTSVGVTSAASTPDDLVQQIVAHFRAVNPDLDVVEQGEWEEIEFR